MLQRLVSNTPSQDKTGLCVLVDEEGRGVFESWLLGHETLSPNCGEGLVVENLPPKRGERKLPPKRGESEIVRGAFAQLLCRRKAPSEVVQFPAAQLPRHAAQMPTRFPAAQLPRRAAQLPHDFPRHSCPWKRKGPNSQLSNTPRPSSSTKTQRPVFSWEGVLETSLCRPVSAASSYYKINGSLTV